MKSSIPFATKVFNFAEAIALFIHHSPSLSDDENSLIMACKNGDHELIMMILQAMTSQNQDVTAAVNQIDKLSNSPLSLAAGLGSAEIVEKLLQLGAKPNHHNKYGIPIIRAVKAKCLEAIAHLIGAGANINVTDVYGNSVLHYAVRSEKVHIVKLVVDSGANVNARNQWNQTPLHWAIQSSKEQINTSLRVEKVLLDSGVDINATDSFGKLLLYYDSG
jgi:ankyrin repeat protein